MSRLPSKAILWTVISVGGLLSLWYDAHRTITDCLIFGGFCILTVWEWVEVAQRHRLSSHNGPQPPAV